MFNTKTVNEIHKAILLLGYNRGKASVKRIGVSVYTVSINGKYLGIYDTNKHTFVD